MHPGPTPTRPRPSLGLSLACTAMLLLSAPGCDSYRPGGHLGHSPLAPATLLPTIPPYPAGELLCVLAQGEDANAVCRDHSLQNEGQLPDGISLRVGLRPGVTLEQAQAELWQDPRIAFVEPNYFLDAPETRQASVGFNEGLLEPGRFWDQELALRLGLRAAHSIANAEGIRVAILDTGTNPSHPVLAGHVLPGWNYVENNTPPLDAPHGTDSNANGVPDEATGHGTHVASLVLLVAPMAEILPMRVLDSDGRGNAFQIGRAIEDATNAGARVINLSLGMSHDSRVLGRAVGFARSRGVTVVAAFGNRGVQDPPEFPGGQNNSYGIAATDSLDRRASFSNFGDEAALSAPGVNVRGAFWTGGYAVWSGTSMSAPLVSGAAALLLGQHPIWSPGEVMARLQATARPLNPGLRIGPGRLDVAAAVMAPVAGRTSAFTSGRSVPIGTLPQAHPPFGYRHP